MRRPAWASSWSWPPQRHSSPVPAGELHPCLLYGLPNSRQGLRLGDGFATLDGMNGVEMNLGFLAKVPHGPIQKPPCRTYLCACHSVHV